jgi:hypothetical protein
VPTGKSRGAKQAHSSTKKSAKAANSKEQRRAVPARKNKKELDSAAQRFVRDLLIRGEAARPTPEGHLPPGATHRIVEDGEEGELPTVEREGFSIS